ncbi:MAG: DUF4058 family protein [Isosphaeraceae bacterium]
MPSPFPGMDPYLEDPRHWSNVHHGLISEIQAQLTARLRPNYYVRVEERVYISDELESDLIVRVPDLQVAPRPGKSKGKGAGTAVLDPTEAALVNVAEPVLATTGLDEEVRQAYLNVIDSAQRSVVAVIEVLSPSNKAPGSAGLESFEQKRREIMGSSSHWIEIDLLREGRSLSARRRVAPCEYLVHVSKATQRPSGLLWPIRLFQRLPVVPIPLRPDDPDAPLDLQAVLTTAYDRAGYDLEIDYRADPVPPLSPELAEWSNRWLQEKGLRKPR